LAGLGLVARCLRLDSHDFANQLFNRRAPRQATIDKTTFTQFVMNGADWALQIRRNPIR
jgi:hypothetical protein